MNSKAKDTLKKLVNRYRIIWADCLLLDRIRFHSVGRSSSMFWNWASNLLKILSLKGFKSSVCKTVRCPFALILTFLFEITPFSVKRGWENKIRQIQLQQGLPMQSAVKTFVGNILFQWVCLLLFHDLWFAWDFSFVGWQRRLEVFWDNICLSCGRPWPRAGWRRRRETITSCFYARIKCCDGRRRPGAVPPPRLLPTPPREIFEISKQIWEHLPLIFLSDYSHFIKFDDSTHPPFLDHSFDYNKVFE